MTHEGIEYVIRARPGRDQWTVLIYFPDASDALNPHSVVKLKDLQTGEETVVAFKSGQ